MDITESDSANPDVPTETDVAVGVDTNLEPDADAEADSAVELDVTVPTDSAPPMDASVEPDSATPEDTAAPTDAVTPTDAPPTDSAPPADASDAAPPSDAGDPSVLWRPTPGTSWQWQLQGTLDTSFDVQVYDIDLFDNSAATIASLHAQGRRVICYISAGTREDWRPDASSFPPEVLGRRNGWPGEVWIDIRSSAVRTIMSARIQLAATRGCDAIEPDNIDGFSNRTGFPLTAADQLHYNRFLAAEAHSRGLSIALKNDVEQVADLVSDFDFAINEQCFRYNECDLLTPFITAGRAVFQVEYGNDRTARSICPQANARNFDTLIKNLDLDAFRIACR